MGQVYISVVIYMSLRGVWHLCNLPCINALSWLLSIASYVFRSPSICFQVFAFRYEINRKDVVYFHCRLFYNDMGLIPKFRNGRSKLEKQNIRLKPEMTDYLCFSPRRILRLPRYSLPFGFPWTPPSVHSPWYQWHNCSSNMTRIQTLFWLGNTSNRQGLFRCASQFLKCDMQISYETVSNARVHQVTVSL